MLLVRVFVGAMNASLAVARGHDCWKDAKEATGTVEARPKIGFVPCISMG